MLLPIQYRISRSPSENQWEFSADSTLFQSNVTAKPGKINQKIELSNKLANRHVCVIQLVS